MATKLSKRPVLIEWVDSHSPNCVGWIGPDEVPHHMTTCLSVGYILNEDKKTITLVAHVAGSEADQVGGVMTIPTCAIVKRNKL